MLWLAGHAPPRILHTGTTARTWPARCAGLHRAARHETPRPHPADDQPRRRDCGPDGCCCPLVSRPASHVCVRPGAAAALPRASGVCLARGGGTWCMRGRRRPPARRLAERVVTCVSEPGASKTRPAVPPSLAAGRGGLDAHPAGHHHRHLPPAMPAASAPVSLLLRKCHRLPPRLAQRRLATTRGKINTTCGARCVRLPTPRPRRTETSARP